MVSISRWPSRGVVHGRARKSSVHTTNGCEHSRSSRVHSRTSRRAGWISTFGQAASTGPWPSFTRTTGSARILAGASRSRHRRGDQRILASQPFLNCLRLGEYADFASSSKLRSNRKWPCRGFMHRRGRPYFGADPSVSPMSNLVSDFMDRLLESSRKNHD